VAGKGKIHGCLSYLLRLTPATPTPRWDCAICWPIWGELQEQTRLQEFVIGAKTTEIVERILAHAPKIVGFGIYIWNVEESTKVVAMLKRVAPHVMVVLGGPEVSYESNEQEIVKLADYLITGWGDVTFPKLCGEILNGPKPLMKIHAGVQPPMAEIKLPYSLYTDDDIKNRTIYVEASRGCPFKCEFCLSALDKTAWPFALESFLAEMESLHARGARLFKFVDRTFNLNIKTSLKIMQFFLDKLEANPDDPVYAHFELVPDHLPDALKEGISKFPPGALQFEIGIQSFNPAVQTLVSRKQDNQKAADNIRWLTEQSHAHMHVDLIAGLPGETWRASPKALTNCGRSIPMRSSSASSSACAARPIIRHTQEFGLVFEPYAPYTILANRDIDFPTMQRLVRFARYWDLVANSGRFGNTLPVLLADSHSNASWPSPTGSTRIPTPPTASRSTGWWRWCPDTCKRRAWTSWMPMRCWPATMPVPRPSRPRRRRQNARRAGWRPESDGSVRRLAGVKGQIQPRFSPNLVQPSGFCQSAAAHSGHEHW
jgi:hypothetical protein